MAHGDADPGPRFGLGRRSGVGTPSVGADADGTLSDGSGAEEDHNAMVT